jgi:hypothetical protein
VDGLVHMLDDEGLQLPTAARMALAALVNQLDTSKNRILSGLISG